VLRASGLNFADRRSAGHEHAKTHKGHPEMGDIPDRVSQVDCDILVIGGGTAGPMAAYKAKVKTRRRALSCWKRPNVKRSGRFGMGMDGLNNAVIPRSRDAGAVHQGNHHRE